MKLSSRLEEYRMRDGYFASPPFAAYGAFIDVPGPCGEHLKIIASDGDVPGELGGWEHVSVSIKRRMPNWTEMCFVKNLFWAPEECAVQFHPPESEYVNNHPHCLHLWRYAKGAFPVPPAIMVGVKDAGILETPAQAAAVRKKAGI